MERKATLGGWCGGRDPYGYRLVKGQRPTRRRRGGGTLVSVIFDRYVNGPARQPRHRQLAERVRQPTERERVGRGGLQGGPERIRNRTYLGEVHFEAHGTHRLIRRSSARSCSTLRRRFCSNPARTSPNRALEQLQEMYCSTGLVVCDSCGRHFTGETATEGTARTVTTHAPRPAQW